jgi:hypothetical protein
MICIRCGRRLSKAAASIETMAEPLNFGRACAVKAGLIHPVKREPRIVPAMPQPEVDERQMALEVFA